MKLWAFFFFVMGFIHVVIKTKCEKESTGGRSSSTLCWPRNVYVCFFFSKKYFKRVVSIDHSMTEIDFIKKEEQMD